MHSVCIFLHTDENMQKRAFPAKIIYLKCSLFLMLFCRLFLPDKQRSAVRPSLQSAVCSTPTALRFCRSTVCTSCRFRTDTDRSDIPLPQHASSACSSQTHPCSFRSLSLPAHAQPSAQSSHDTVAGSYPPECSPSSRRTCQILPSCTRQADLCP